MRARPGLLALTVTALAVWWLLPHEATVLEPTPLTATPQSWTYTSSMNIARRAFTLAANHRFVYAIGGIDNDGSYVATTEYAAYSDNGALSPWRLTAPLQVPRFYLGAVVIADWIYAIGGATGPRGDDNVPSATVERARILPDGALSAWEQLAPLSSPRRGLQTVTAGNTVYALGGYNGAFLRDAEYALVQPDGTLSAWQHHDTDAHVERYMHAAASNAHAVFLVAGHVVGVGSGHADIEVAAITPQQRLAPWSVASPRLPSGRFLACAAADDTLLAVIGGHDGTQQLASVEVASLHGGTHPGRWRAGPSLNSARSAAAAVRMGNYLIVGGGALGDTALSTVETIPLRALRSSR